ncbi:Zinc finger BED domain-containing protein DAYSLEEPER [Fusarium oxysporum f. sp. albedinis]|nr:Zinc finger BED domain-containing protein DAYSLEEPER [Fusarium oxysporum f. sp. albedinis]
MITTTPAGVFFNPLQKPNERQTSICIGGAAICNTTHHASPFTYKGHQQTHQIVLLLQPTSIPQAGFLSIHVNPYSIRGCRIPSPQCPQASIPYLAPHDPGHHGSTSGVWKVSSMKQFRPKHHTNYCEVINEFPANSRRDTCYQRL